MEQTNVLEFYVKYFVIPPLLNGPQILSLESDQMKLRVDFLKKTLTWKKALHISKVI